MLAQTVLMQHTRIEEWQCLPVASKAKGGLRMNLLPLTALCHLFPTKTGYVLLLVS